MVYRTMLAAACLLATGSQAYAPIQMVSGKGKGLVVLPQGFRGNFRGALTPHKLFVRSPASNDSPSSLPYFTARLDQTITWDDVDWCLEATGNKHGDAVRVNSCSGARTQKWNWIPDGRGHNMIRLRNTELCLHTLDTKVGPHGAPIELWGCGNEAAQWQFEEPLSLRDARYAMHGDDARYAMIVVLTLAGLGTVSLSARIWQVRATRHRDQESVCAVMALDPIHPPRVAQPHASRISKISVAKSRPKGPDSSSPSPPPKHSRLPNEHEFPVGSEAVIFKLHILSFLLRHLGRGAQFVYVDTHAGRGADNLFIERKEKASQRRRLANVFGIQLLRQANDSLPDATQEPLRALFAGDDPAKVLCLNGYKALINCAVAIPSRRALVFCDPSYKLESDIQQTEALVAHLAKRWRSATVAIWYPVAVDTSKMARLKDAVWEASRPFEVLSIEMVWSDGKGTGLLLVQPPSGIDVQLQKELLLPLAATLKPVKTRWQWLCSSWNLKQPLVFEPPSEDVRLAERDDRVTNFEQSLAALLKADVLDRCALARLVGDASSWLAPPKAKSKKKSERELDGAAESRLEIAVQRRLRDVLIQGLEKLDLDLSDKEILGIVQPALDIVREFENKHSIEDACHREQWGILILQSRAVDRGSENVPTEPSESGVDASGGSRMAYKASEPYAMATVTKSKAPRRFEGSAYGLPDVKGLYVAERILPRQGSLAYVGYLPYTCEGFEGLTQMWCGYRTPENQVGPDRTAKQAFAKVVAWLWRAHKAGATATGPKAPRQARRYQGSADGLPDVQGAYITQRIRKGGVLAYECVWPSKCGKRKTNLRTVGPNRTAEQAFAEVEGLLWQAFKAGAMATEPKATRQARRYQGSADGLPDVQGLYITPRIRGGV